MCPPLECKPCALGNVDELVNHCQSCNEDKFLPHIADRNMVPAVVALTMFELQTLTSDYFASRAQTVFALSVPFHLLTTDKLSQRRVSAILMEFTSERKDDAPEQLPTSVVEASP